MLFNTCPSWLRPLRSRFATPPRRGERRRSYRPRCEVLEDRCLPSTFTVVNTDDGGPGSLRQAILDANANSGADAINFAIPGAGVHTIAPASPLPAITDPVTIDAATQPGYAGSPLIELNGADAGTADGLTITAANSVVRGLTINRFSNGSGIVISGIDATGNTIEGDYLGTDPSGTMAEGNSVGVFIDHAANNIIGGATAAERNVISGNNSYGVLITGIVTGGATGNLVQGNFIGTDATGTQAVANGFFGINISDGSYNHVDGNVISGNGDLTLPYDAGPAGITVAQDFGTAQYNTVTNNKIGVGADGTTPVPNLQGVIFGGGARFNTFEGNIIAHNIWQGVQIFGDGLPQPMPTSDNVFRNNQIIDNGGNGLEIAAGPGLTFDWASTGAFTTIPDNGAQRNTFQDNNISGNGGNGIVIDGIRGDGNFLYGNSIASNGGDGVVISGGAQGNQIGGTGPGQANLIRDNAGAAVLFRTLGYDFNLDFAFGFPPGLPSDGFIANSPDSPTADSIVPVTDNAVQGNAIFANSGPVIDAAADVTTPNTVQGNFVGPNYSLGTDTVLSSSSAAIVHGQIVTFTATVQAPFSSGTPTGSVQFRIDGVPVGGPVALQGGSASFTTMAVPVGTHTITADYNSDTASFLGSTSSQPLTLTVSPARAILFVAQQQNITVQLGTIIQVPVSITNTDSIPHDLTSLSAVDPLVDIPVHFEISGSLPRTMAPGETIQATLVIDATSAANSQVEVQGVLTSTGEPAQDNALFSIVVVQPGAPAQPDLTVSLAGGISPNNPAAGSSVTIQATVHNAGGAASDASQISFLAFSTAANANVEIGRVAVPALAAGGSTVVSFSWDTANVVLPFPSAAGVVLLSARVDPANLIAEVKEGNNSASQLLTIGSAPVVMQGFVSVQGSVGLVCGADLPVSGVAQYDIPSGQTTLHFPVQGGIVTVQVLDAATGALLKEVTGYHTDVNGNYGVPIPPPSVDTLVRITVSDTGFAGTQSLRLPVALIPPPDSCVGANGVPEPPPTPPSPATPPGDIFVYSEDIQFLGSSHPAAGATTTILASIHLGGTVPAYDVPVEVNAIYADGGALHTVEIGHSVISFPNGGQHGAALVSVDWTNAGDAPYVIQVVAEPPYAQYTGNDDATREITVGAPAATAQIDVSGALSTRCGGEVSANLTATYVITADGQSFTFPVEGGDFALRRLNADTGANIDQAGGHSDVAGAFSFGRGSLGAVNTIIRTDVTDTTLAYERDILSPACVPNPTPPAPNTPPAQPQDVYVFAEDIAFSNANPNLGQTIAIFATVHYYGNPPALGVPVAINDIYPVGDVLVTAEIGHTTVDFPDGGADGPAFVIINWTNHLTGAHIVQVAAEPSFAQYTGNDEATRLLFVGALTPQAGNTPPLAFDDAFVTNEDTPLVIAATDLLANDVDAELNPLTATVVTAPAHGTLTQNPDGSFTYTPAANFNGTDHFTYKANDGHLDSAPATVTITVNPVNDPPVADNQTLVTDEDTAVSGSVTATDVEGEPLTFALVSGPSHGSLSFSGNGSFTYTPAANYNGSDSFTFKANDGSLDSVPATVTITVNPVNDPPTANNDAFTVDEDSGPADLAVLANDTTAPDTGETLTITSVSAGSAGGTMAILGGTTVRYEPALHFFGTETFTYTINDGTPGSNATATVTMTVTPVRFSHIEGMVWEDFNGDGKVDFGERAIPGVLIHLTGTDDRGHSVVQTMTTDGQGIFEFAYLRPSDANGYRVSEDQPLGFADGIESLGTVNGVLTGVAVDNVFSHVTLLLPGDAGENYNFGERPLPGPLVHSGQTATIGFWQNSNGQNLIKSLNGGANATQLGNWLAATFPNIYGAHAGANNLSGKTNTQIAAFYTSLFKVTSSVNGPPKVDAQTLAVALAVYVTNQQLAGTTAAAYGFQVTAGGAGTASFDVGAANRAAFGLAATDSTMMTVLDVLLAANARSRNGLLYDSDGSGTISSSEKSLRGMANTVLTAINEQGDI